MLDKEKIIENFSRSAAEYEKHAFLQMKMADELLASVRMIKASKILDVGCGTGYLADQLAKSFPAAEVVGIDIAPGMIETAKVKYKQNNLLFAVGDGEGLPFGRAAFDLVVSNASLQWMSAPAVFAEVNRVIIGGGRFFFSTFGPATLREMKLSGFRINQFDSIKSLKTAARGKFKSITIGSSLVAMTFKSIKEIIFHLKEVGANTNDRAKMNDKELFKAFKKYNNEFKVNGQAKISYEIIFGQCDR
jgi:malonyl-CoA O-methyltransferase